MLDKAVMRPIAKEYTRVTPKGVRAHIHDFFTNLVMPVTIVNDLLQLKPIHAVKDTGRFLTDSTIGLAGFFHPATRWGMPPHYEDFGITLARWGVPSGPYVVLPFFGPSDLRDALGLYTDSYATPVRYFDNIKLRNGVLMGQAVDTRAQYLDYDQMLRQAYDPYALMRSAYFQNRDHTIRQNIPGARQEELPNYNEMLKNPGHGNGGAKQMPPQ